MGTQVPLPTRWGGSGWGLRPFQFLKDPVEYVLHSLIGLVGWHPNHSKSLRFQILGLAPIAILVLVARAVNLHSQPSFQADEVDEVGPDWELASELVAGELPAAQSVPNACLGLAHVAAQLTSALGFRRWHAMTIAQLGSQLKVGR